MATNTGEINKVLLEKIFKIYQDAEMQMLEKVTKRVKKGITTEGWNEAKLKDVQELNKEISKILNDTSKVTKGHLNKGLIKAYEAGMKGASLDFAKIKPGKIPNTFMKEMIPYHLQRLILEQHNMVDRASVQILRNTQDVYRDIIAETNTGVLAGYETRLQASQNALNRFAVEGITGFIDKAGRKWELASYVEMATRTGNAHAALQGHVDRQLELDNDLIIVSSHANTCPLCAPWGGKVLSITGKTPDYPTLQQAIAEGLFHPNCKHTITAYFPFIDEPEEHVHDKGYNPGMYEAIQKQRYNERMIRMWKRREVVALTPEESFRAHNKVLQWQRIQREHISEYNLRRKYVRESIESRTGDASKVKLKINKPEIILPKPKDEIKLDKDAIIAKIKELQGEADKWQHEFDFQKYYINKVGQDEYEGKTYTKDNLNELELVMKQELKDKLEEIEKLEEKIGIKKQVKPVKVSKFKDDKIYEPMTEDESEKSINSSKAWFNDNNSYKESFKDYTGTYHKSINRCLRGNKRAFSVIKEKIDTMVKAYKDPTMPKPFTKNTELYRATGYSYLRNAEVNQDLIHKIEGAITIRDKNKLNEYIQDLKNSLIDTIVEEKSFTSTSYDRWAFGADKPIQLTIKAAPEVSRAIQLAGISSFEEEAEILFAPGMRNIIEDVKVDESPYSTCLNIIIRVLGHSE